MLARCVEAVVRVRRAIVIVLLPFASVSCATMFDSTTSDVTFLSEPTGATVRVDDQEGTTPFHAKISKKTKEATFSHPEYPDRVVSLNRHMKAGYVLMDLLFTPGFGLVGLIVDGTSGAWFSHPGVISVDFVNTQPPPETEGAATAEESATQ